MDLYQIAQNINQLLVQIYEGFNCYTATYYAQYADYKYDDTVTSLGANPCVVIGIQGIQQSTDIVITQAENLQDALE